MPCALYETGVIVVGADSGKELLFVELFYVSCINNVKLLKENLLEQSKAAFAEQSFLSSL